MKIRPLGAELFHADRHNEIKSLSEILRTRRKGCFDFLVIIHYSCSISITVSNALHKYTCILLISIKHTRLTTCITQYCLCLLEFTHLWCFLTVLKLSFQKPRYCQCQYFAKFIFIILTGRKRSIYVLYEFIKYSNCTIYISKEDVPI